MNGSQLIHVVALIRARTGVHEAEHTGDEQCGLVVCYGERSGKDGAGFSVLALAVAEEE